MTDFLLVLIGVLLAATIGASVEYYKQIRKAKKEYEKAKEAVEDIVLSFNRELKREVDKLEIMAYRVEGITSKADAGLKRVGKIEKKITSFESQIKAINENSTGMVARVTKVDDKTRDAEASHETLKARISRLEEQAQKFFLEPEGKSEPVIPIKRDKAMAALTDTEVTVLELLSMEGAKTAPEIKDIVHLSREHTARLMKKLYEKGYVERETGKIPFKYSVKKEMAKLLKKAESEQT
ncbi:MAG: MarR family transcriptional regulator [Candidatus Bathyarchaeota archaeon]|nr:MAG: MarR family transcriptional regulator [Candidatus Bathyarchaeota archaeon]